MRRTLLALVALAALSCATPRTPGPAAAPGAAGTEGAHVLPGFERQPGERVIAYDVTRSGRPNVWKYVVMDASGKEFLARKEKDLDGDGRVDTWERYGTDGTVVLVAHDLDFDSRPDETLTFEKGQLVRKEMAFGFDGIPRSWSFYEEGKLVRKERDTNGDARVDYWEYWDGGEIDRIGVDLDGDGQVDRWEARRGEGSPVPGGQK